MATIFVMRPCPPTPLTSSSSPLHKRAEALTYRVRKRVEAVRIIKELLPYGLECGRRVSGSEQEESVEQECN